ncbi:universal stress protein [Pontibacter qinzhouensis]|uniref:Universal stress protein n=1 Tax=Pontibacter qinzhouensis TaxID=2603253 RepID=A0A5C8K580_9BACT|nr:universal stress protein [Pontibacter qinzhouensis]TXK44842.1 universal stress protein [Pontibacter qinzhouensis]
MKNILVPTDFSAIAHNAFLYALEVAQQQGAQITLVHVFHYPILSPIPHQQQVAIAMLEHKMLRKLEGFANDTWQKFSASKKRANTKSGGTSASVKPVTITPVCRFGLTVPEILQVIQEYKTDFVVMGMRGTGLLEQAFLGSTTLQLIQQSHLPVMAIPADQVFSGLKSIVFAVDLARFPTKQMLRPLQHLLAAFKCQLHVLHVYRSHIQKEEREKAFAALNNVERYFHNLPYKLFFKEKEDVAEGILQYVATEQADLLVLSPSQHSFLDRLLNKSVTGKVAAQASVPLLALPGKAAPAFDSTKTTKVLQEVA